MVEPNELLFHSMAGGFSSKKTEIKSSILALEEHQQLLIKAANFNKSFGEIVSSIVSI